MNRNRPVSALAETTGTYVMDSPMVPMQQL
jgi:hypothetical protein